MDGKNATLLALLVVLGGLAYWIFGDSFRRPEVKVFVTMRPKIPARGIDVEHPPEDRVVFGLGTELRLTDVQVVPVAALQTNQLAPPVWHVVSDSNSVPTSTFAYGERIRGMRPRNAGTKAEPLAPSTEYRITVRAGSQTGRYDFKTRGEAEAAP